MKLPPGDLWSDNCIKGVQWYAKNWKMLGSHTLILSFIITNCWMHGYYTIQSKNIIFISCINQIKSSDLFQNHSMHQVNLNYNSIINMGESSHYSSREWFKPWEICITAIASTSIYSSHRISSTTKPWRCSFILCWSIIWWRGCT